MDSYTMNGIHLRRLRGCSGIFSDADIYGGFIADIYFIDTWNSRIMTFLTAVLSLPSIIRFQILTSQILYTDF